MTARPATTTVDHRRTDRGEVPGAVDQDAVGLVRRCPAPLAPFNRAGVLVPVDVHAATALARLAERDGGVVDDNALLGLALAVRAPRLGHACVDLATVADVATVESPRSPGEPGGAGGPGAHGVPGGAGGPGASGGSGGPGASEAPGGAGASSEGGRTAGSDDGEVAALPWPVDIDGWVTSLHRTGLAPSVGREDAGPGDAGPGEAGPGEVGPGSAGPGSVGGGSVGLGSVGGGSPVGGFGAGPSDDAPLRLLGTRLYLDRHLRDERTVARRLRTLAAAPGVVDADPVAADVLDEVLDAVLGGAGERQHAACARSFRAGLTVLAGGPGTGKTYTVTRLVAAHVELAERLGRRAPRVALAAPTGRAAARMESAVREGIAELTVAPATRELVAGITASTIHRLLGRAVGSLTQPRHDAHDPLEVDLVVVDETSMVPLALMARLLDALPEGARLVLVGDPDQLESVEAGTVLGDVIGPGTPDADGPVAGRVVTLDLARRFGAGSGIARLAAAVRSGDDDAVVDVLSTAPTGDLVWLQPGGSGVASGGAEDPAVAAVRGMLVASGAEVVRAAADGDAAAATAAAGAVQILCAHRRGPTGVQSWNRAVERWLAAAHPDLFGVHGPAHGEYAGRPVLLTRNDHRRGLYNGDSGVVVLRDPAPDDPDGEPVPTVAFAGTGAVREFAASRIGHLETAWAMTIHKSQGSQFDHVVVVLPDAASRLLTRELLYTAVTRARSRVTVLGPETALRGAVRRRVPRIGGLREALWGTADGGAGVPPRR